ncbi:lysine transporter LysE [Vibrio sp. UCD-FRSSP16_10]|uniref:LysE family translocator n=1 Tax=unclassified Vibrio TaxID=2614977 RepID=UPI0007FFC9E9|nr:MULTISPECIES: LysE family translocator [unclassified Vibrio]OBT16004.1 lysine transporter LysE [Vibrio sp. UCD-FRSSP16_30]OBT21087.1 lysine transporter LysE [Vibrio sp. UCD-FRSSP16_10]
MELQQFSALLLFALVSTSTPGPNNIMLMSSGANIGFKKTIPHMLGITIGFALMLILVGIGLIGTFNSYPQSHAVLKYVSLGYLLYLAFKIASSKITSNKVVTSNKVKTNDAEKANTTFKPMGFLAAASFQWLNPKGWSMALTAITLFTASGAWIELIIVAGAFTLANIPSVTLWTVAGSQLQQWLTTPLRIRGFNIAMASLLLLTAIPML